MPGWSCCDKHTSGSISDDDDDDDDYFVVAVQVTPSVEEEHDLDEEIRNTVKKIIRDFVSSWYSTVSSERSFEAEVQDAMISMGMELKRRAKQVDRKVR